MSIYRDKRTGRWRFDAAATAMVNAGEDLGSRWLASG